MNDALLGYTGLVGSHLRENLSPDKTKYFNSKNISDVIGQEFDTVYCACVPEVEDLREINTLKDILTKVKCRRFFLISTIDVHSREVLDQVEDNVVPSKEPYGMHRYNLEVFLRQHFGRSAVIVRLPALFGVGLKKNYLYDLINNNQIDKINVNTSFQWYSLSWLWEDMVVALEDGRQTVNLYSEAIETRDIVARFFPQYKPSQLNFGSRVFYSQSSIYGGRSTHEVLGAMADYIGLENMKKNRGKQNHLVASNMAWKTEHDEHAAFLMQRYGIDRLELLPTKLASWDVVFRENLEKQLDVFRRHGIKVYSVQSVFHGVEGKFGDDNIREHLEKVVKFCENVGAEALVVGSPAMRGRNCDRKALADLLENVQNSTKVKICLEPNSAVYRCQVGTTLDECQGVRGDRNFFLNYDTGNAHMEKDRLPETHDRIGHVQIGNSLLTPMKRCDYERILKSGMCGAIAEVVGKSKGEVKISLEVSMFDNIKLFGEQIRRFSRFCRTYFVDAKS